jgi:hypothetical protein
MSTVKKFELYLKTKLNELKKRMETPNPIAFSEAEAAYAELNYIFVNILPELKREFKELRNS